MKLNRLNAVQELAVDQYAKKLLPKLLGYGISVQDAIALAHNTVVLFFALGEDRPEKPEQILHKFSLVEIAKSCEELDNPFEDNQSFKEEFN